jgi:hypothetical protein|tara:strand:- start:1367 stop:1756 length:390 start_codon:yes stop_codon:yes gene_type:complete
MAFTYFVLQDTKDLVNIPLNVESEDGILEQLGTKVDQYFTNQMTAYAELLPLTDGNLTSARQAVNQYVCALYMARKQNFEAAKFYDDKYKETFNTLVSILTADPTNRTKRVAVKKAYRTEPLKSDPLLE